ncbi:MAG: hypothetical protein MUF53_06620 [Gemmatimonadaceae bacterium]|nr:hypothetical protein [Gemmatimonadaceae bacterium]
MVPGASGPWTTVVQAQVVERQVPFDADGRLLVLTPTLVTRLGLGAPDWPVPPGFDEAKLYVSGDSAFVLVVRRGDRNERYPLTVEQRDALGRRIAAAAAASGMPTQEVGTSGLEESARGQFVRTQSGLGVLWYGTWAVLATERLEAWAVTSAAAFFASQAIARSTEVTVPMASMASDLALRAGAATLLVSPDALHPQALGAAALATSLVGAVAGFQAGRSLTAAEAEATGWGSSTLAIAVAGLAASADWGERATRGATAAALVAGLPLGLQYPRRAPYVLTAGDLYAMRVPQAIGAGAGLSLALALDASDRSLILGATLGYLGGVALGDRLIAKPYDFALWQAVLLGTGASVSAFAASALLSSGPQDGAGYAAILTGAAALGAFASAALMDLTPGRVAGRQVGDASGRPARVARPAPGSRGRPSFRLDPMAALTAAAKAPGRHAIVTLTF